jgi:hypothetical protein
MGYGWQGQSLNPGNLKTALVKNLDPWSVMLTRMLTHEPIYGAYMELFAGLSPDITTEQSGAWSRNSSFSGLEVERSADSICSHPLGSLCPYSKGS